MREEDQIHLDLPENTAPDLQPDTFIVSEDPFASMAEADITRAGIHPAKNTASQTEQSAGSYSHDQDEKTDQDTLRPEDTHPFTRHTSQNTSAKAEGKHMPLNISVPEVEELKPRIVVFGVGGAGGNAVNNMISSHLNGVEFVVANTDSQALTNSAANRRVQLGGAVTQGLGAGSVPEVGRAAAEESADEIMDHLQGCHMAFIAAGMGGGTGTGAAAVIARLAREAGVLTVGVVTKPFQFEGSRRMTYAEKGIEELQKYVDTLIVIPNQNLFCVANQNTTFAEAFQMADNVLAQGVRGITDLMVNPGLINLDFADVKTVMHEMGKAVMGTGESEGDERAVKAAQMAISNPLLEDISLQGAKGVLISIAGGADMTLHEVDNAAKAIREEVDPDANIIFGATIDAEMEGIMRVSLIATGMDVDISTINARNTTLMTDAVSTKETQKERSVLDDFVITSQIKPAETALPLESAPTARASEHPASGVQSGAHDDFFAMPGAVSPAVVATPSNLSASAQSGTPTTELGQGQPDPFRAADMANAGHVTVPPVAPQTHQETAVAGAAAVAQPVIQSPAPQEPLLTPSVDPVSTSRPSLFDRMMGRKSKTAPQTAERTEPSVGQEARVTMLSQNTQAQNTSADEEELDIPAFMRRQTN